MFYAKRVKANPQKSVTYSQKEELENFFLGGAADGEFESKPLTLKRSLVLVVFAATFAVCVPYTSRIFFVKRKETEGKISLFSIFWRYLKINVSGKQVSLPRLYCMFCQRC
jgi:uncharacterized ion transporter superfamily protein YfcC